MAFRERPPEPLARAELLGRYLELERGFVHDVQMFGHRGPYLLAAAALLGAPTERAPKQLVEATLVESAAIATHPAWLAAQGPALRLVLAALLVAHERGAQGFIDERSRLHDAMEAAGVHYSPLHRTLMIFALRAGLDARGQAQQDITEAQIDATAALYTALRRKHRLLCNERLLPICAWLSVGLAPEPGRRASPRAAPERLAQQISALYKGMRRSLGLRRGRPLLAAAAILARAGLESEVLVARVGEVQAAFVGAGMQVGDNEYDELAILSLLPLPVERSVNRLVELHDALVAAREWTRWTPAGVDLASSLLLSELCAKSDPLLTSLVQLELLLDTMTMVSAQESWNVFV